MLLLIRDMKIPLEDRNKLLYDLRNRKYPPGLASHGLDNEESHLIDQCFEVEFSILEQMQKFKDEGKPKEEDGIETAMVHKSTTMVNRIKRMLVDKKTCYGKLSQVSEQKLKSVSDRLTRIERSVPLLQALADNEEETKAINVFFKEELPACHKELKKLRDARKEDFAKPIEYAMAEKLSLMMKQVEEKDKQ